MSVGVPLEVGVSVGVPLEVGFKSGCVCVSGAIDCIIGRLRMELS